MNWHNGAWEGTPQRKTKSGHQGQGAPLIELEFNGGLINLKKYITSGTKKSVREKIL